MPQRTPSYTKAQQSVLRILARGASNAEIAAALRIEVSTVKRHVGSIMLKAEVKNRVQLAIHYLSSLSAESKEQHFAEFRLRHETRAGEIVPGLDAHAIDARPLRIGSCTVGINTVTA